MALRQPSVVVIGAGMTGILAVIKLREMGISDITVFEKSANVGGTWYDNRYPGVACDVPSHMYTYSFEPNPTYSKLYADGAEIRDYFERVADKYGVYPFIRFNQEVTKAKFDTGKWHVETKSGDRLIADFIIGATGILREPAMPSIEGLDSFRGRLMHTARFNPDVPFNPTQRVGVIGTGATAAQVVGELVPTGAQVTVFQRTAQWIVKGKNIEFSARFVRFAKQVPLLVKAIRYVSQLVLSQVLTKAVIGRPWHKRLLEKLAHRNLNRSIKDEHLRKQLTPDYQVGCKRIIINETFYPAIQQPNAQLVTSGIARVVPDGVITDDGKLHPLHTLILATGFDAKAFMRPMTLIGENGLQFDEHFATNLKTYRSILVRGFPNYFLMLGSNTPIGNYSVIAMSEVQIDYVCQLIKQWQLGEFNQVQPTEAAVERFTTSMKSGLKNTVWVGGCNSWYLNAEGDPILWPYTWSRWVKEMKTPCWNDLETSN